MCLCTAGGLDGRSARGHRVSGYTLPTAQGLPAARSCTQSQLPPRRVFEGFDRSTRCSVPKNFRSTASATALTRPPPAGDLSRCPTAAVGAAPTRPAAPRRARELAPALKLSDSVGRTKACTSMAKWRTHLGLGFDLRDRSVRHLAPPLPLPEVAKYCDPSPRGGLGADRGATARRGARAALRHQPNAAWRMGGVRPPARRPPRCIVAPAPPQRPPPPPTPLRAAAERPLALRVPQGRSEQLGGENQSISCSEKFAS